MVAWTGSSKAGYGVPGSDSDSVEGSRALPAIWADGSDIGAKAGALTDAAWAVQAAAATDLDALKAAMGPLGKACGACHETYRLPKN